MLDDDSMMIEEALQLEWLACANGGDGGDAVPGSLGLGGSGGGGGVLMGIAYLVRGQSYPVVFSAGNVTFVGQTAIKGGNGGSPGGSAQDGGSGGEGGNGGGAGGNGTPGQGTDGADDKGGAGGAGGGFGVTSSFSGSLVTYGAPGGSAAGPGRGGHGADGGNGDAMAYAPPGPGTAGRFVARYLGPQQATGGTVTSSGGYTIHTLTGTASLALY